jgi:hypothetical protein
MKMFKHIALFLLSGLLFFACNQDPIFFEVSLEVKPIPPLISGAPTNIVAVKDTMYVASKRGTVIYRYKCDPADPSDPVVKNGEWIIPLSSPGGKIIELAATENALYVLCGEPMSATLWRYKDNSWTPIEATNVQTIYGAGTYLFAGNATLGSSSNPTLTGSILYVDETKTSLSSLASSTGQLLSGAAFMSDTYYLATSGSGLFTVEEALSGGFTTAATPADTKGHTNLVGIKQVGNTIVAVAREGYGAYDYILYGSSGSFTPVLTSVKFTGAIATYKEGDVNKLLLLGIQGSSTSTTYGYREILLDDNGILTSYGLQTPGTTTPSSVSDEDQYTVTIGAQPLSSIFQAADGTPFASTIQKGLWSYRTHDDKSYWNTEG